MIKNSDIECTCDTDDFGMGHGQDCPVGDINKYKSVLEMCVRLEGYDIPTEITTKIREWAIDGISRIPKNIKLFMPEPYSGDPTKFCGFMDCTFGYGHDGPHSFEPG